MFVDPEFTPLIDQCTKDFDEIWSLPLEEFKAAWTSSPPSLLPEIPSLSEIDVSKKLVRVSDGTEVEIQIYSPKSMTKSLPLLFVTHGGGWVVGSHSMEESMMRNVCVKNQFVVISVDYRMAPEFRFPYAVNDSFDVLKWCQSNADELRINPQQIIVAGGSAGGNLAAVLSLKYRDEGITGIIGQVLNIPVTCHPRLFPREKYPYSSYEENKDAISILSKSDQYLPDVQKNAYHSPLLAESFSNLPPALIQVAGMDTLRDEGLAYGEALKRSGIDVTLKRYPGLPHGFSMYTQLSQTPIYHQTVVDWITKQLSSL